MNYYLHSLRGLFSNITLSKASNQEGKITAFYTKASKWVFLVFKLSITYLTLWYLYRHVWQDADFQSSYVLLKLSLSGTFAITLLSCSVIMIGINWGFEALKWKALVEKFSAVSFMTSFKAILAGMAVSLWIPNRTGEYLGRVLYVPAGKRMKGILATLVGSVAQLIVTLVMGCAGLLFYIYFSLKNYYLFTASALLVIVLSGLLLFLYFHIQKVKKFIPNYSWLNKAKKYARLYTHYSMADLGKVLHFSFLRYLVFCSQFLILAYMFGAKLPLMEGFFTLFMIYLIQTAVPTTALTELGVRGVTTIFFFKAYTTNMAAVLAASYTLWFINLAIPGIIGLGFLLVKKYRKEPVIDKI